MKNYPTSITQVIKEFGDNTTSHGPGHIAHYYGSKGGVFWTIVTFTLLIFLVYVCGLLCIEFMSRGVKSQVRN